MKTSSPITTNDTEIRGWGTYEYYWERMVIWNRAEILTFTGYFFSKSTKRSRQRANNGTLSKHVT